MDEFLENTVLPKYLHTMLKVFLYTFGMFPRKYKIYSTIYYWIYVISVTGAITGSLIPLYFATQSVIKLEIFSTIIPQLSDLLIFIYFYHKKTEVLDLIRNLTNNHSNRILERTDTFFTIKFITYFVIHTAWASIFMISTFLYLLTHEEFSNKYSLMIPFWLSCDVRGGHEKYFCWRTDTSQEVWLANTITTIAVGFEYWVYCAACIFYSVCMANVWIHLETLRLQIREMADNMRSTCRRNLMKYGKLDKYDDAVIEEFRRNIKYQQFIRSYSSEIISVMRGYIFIFLIEFWGTLTFVAFTIIMEANSDRILIVKTFVISVSGAAGFVMHCLYAQVITDQNIMILSELADIPWYDQSIRFRKMYVMCLTHNQKAITVSAGGMYTFNYGFSMRCVKTMYSFLNMMLLHFRRKGSL